MDDENARRLREWHRLLMDAQDIEHAYRGLGKGVTYLLEFLAEHGGGGPQLSRPGLARALAEWRDRRLAIDGYFADLERYAMNNLPEQGE